MARPGGEADLLDREPLPDADGSIAPDPSRPDRHGVPDPARLAFQRPADGARVGPRTARDRVAEVGDVLHDVPTRQLTAAVLITLAGVGLLLGWAVHLSWTPLVDVALIVLGLALVVQARSGPVSRPLIALGVVLAVVAATTWRAGVTLDGGLGRRTVVVASSRTIDQHLGTGQLRLDLTQQAARGPSVDVHASVGIGRLVVEVPDGAVVVVHAVAGSGAAIVFSHRHAGPGVDVRAISGTGSARQIHLDLRVGLGTVEVRRAR